MFFDFLIEVKMPNNKSQIFGAWKELHSMCIATEMTARTDPDTCLINIRQALEILFSGLYLESVGSDLPETLHETMKQCESISGLWDDECNIGPFFSLKKKANDIVHILKNVTGARQYEIKDRHANVEMASRLTIRLYVGLLKIFRITNAPIPKPEMLPFGEYEVIKKIEKKPYESIEGEYKYIVRQKNDNISTYAYIRPFLNTDDRTVFNDRDMEAQMFFKNMRGSNSIIKGDELRTSRYCDLKYLKYEIQENTRTLDEIVEKLKPYELLDIIEQITNGLSNLASSKISIHHRGIRPTCIFVTSFDDGYEAKIGCFETAKIDYTEKNMETVYSWVSQAASNNIYTHPLLRSEGEHDGSDWEAGDVYSLAVILVSSMDPTVEKTGTIDTSELYDCYSDDFIYEIDRITKAASLKQIPSIREFDEMLKKELANGED